MDAVVILAAGAPKRMTGKPKPLLDIKGKNILKRQIIAFRKKYPKCFFVVVCGYKWTDIIDDYGKDVIFIINDEYKTLGQAHSAFLGGSLAKNKNAKSVLFVNGDLVFDPKGLKDLSKEFIMAGGNKQRSEVGLNICNKKVIGLGYALKPRWAQIFALTENLEEFLKTCESNPNLFTFEILNKINKNGIAVVENDHFLIDIDTRMDLEKANAYFS